MDGGQGNSPPCYSPCHWDCSLDFAGSWPGEKLDREATSHQSVVSSHFPGVRSHVRDSGIQRLWPRLITGEGSDCTLWTADSCARALLLEVREREKMAAIR